MANPTERQLQVSQRGVIVGGVDLVMGMLQSLAPRVTFAPGPSGAREAVLGDPWRRGGTTPGGSSFSGPVGSGGPGQIAASATGNYFIGWAEDKTDSTPPQAALWTPPEVGQERYGPAQVVGWVVDQSPDGSQLLRPATAADIAGDSLGVRAGRGYGSVGVEGQTGVGATPGAATGTAPAPAYGQGDPGQGGGRDRVLESDWGATMGIPDQGAVPGGNARVYPAPGVTSWARTKVVPMTCSLWGSDWDDTELLGLNLCSAAETVWQGTLAHMGEGVVASSGWVRDAKATRGLHYVVVVNFACPIIYPPSVEGRLYSFSASVGRIGT